MNLIVPRRRQNNILDLQEIDLVVNKENIPLAPDPQNKRPPP
jgi:hypothetical protein